MFAAMLAAPREGEPPDAAIAALEAAARDFSPRIERYGDREVVLDASGLERLIGDAPVIAAALQRTAADRGRAVRVAITGTRTASRLLVHCDRSPEGLRHDAGLTVVDRGAERQAVAALPIDLLAVVVDAPDILTLRRWGLRTLGDFAALPDADVAARLGQAGVAWQARARGADPGPLVPAAPEERFEQALDLEWPIEELEPLSFVLGRLLEPLSAHLERRDRGAAVLRVRLHLVTREVYERSLELPAPMRDARTLRTLALLDLESNPPPAPIDRVVVAVDPTPGRIVQYSLLTRALPSPERLSTLMARLTALMGEGRCGSPAPVDSWRPGAFELRPFQPEEPDRHQPSTVRLSNRLHGSASSLADLHHPPGPVSAVRRFRHPVPVRIRLEGRAPVRVTTDRRGLAGGRVAMCAGPWRSSGTWWDSDLWNRDEWDVTLQGGETYRLFLDRESGNWFLDGIVD